MAVFKRYIFLTISALLFLTGCKKENDTFPRVSILSVNQGGSYDFGDTIIVRASIEDRDGPIILSLLQGNSPFSLPSETFSQVGNTYTFLLFVTDKYFETGNYDIRVSAFNGENRSSGFKNIHIDGLEKAYRGISYITTGTAGSTLFKQDSVGNIINRPFTQYKYKKLVSDSRNASLISLPETVGSVQGFDFEDLTRDYESILSPLNSLEYQNLFIEDDEVYLIVKDGRVMSVSENGQISPRITLAEVFLPQLIAFNDDQLLMSVKKQGTSLHDLVLIRRANNFILQQLPITSVPIDMAHADGDIYFLTYLKNGNAVVAEFNTQSGLITEKYSINGEVPQALQVAGSLSYLATDQSVYSFPTNSFQFPSQVFSFGVMDFDYDDVNNELYFASGKNLWKTPVGNSQNQYVAATADSIVSISIMFNK